MAEVLKIKSEAEYEKAVEALERLWDAKEGTPEHQAKEVLVELVHEYEESGGDEVGHGLRA